MREIIIKQTEVETRAEIEKARLFSRASVSAGGLEPPTLPIKSGCSTGLNCTCLQVLMFDLVSAGGLEPPTLPIKSGCSTGLNCTCLQVLMFDLVSAGGLEPPTLCLKGRCSTPELRARFLEVQIYGRSNFIPNRYSFN